MYHPTIQKLDLAASEFDAMGMQQLCNGSFLLAGQLQQELLKRSPYKTGRRFLHAQWAWALGHIGLLYQLIRWFRLHEPDTQLVLETTGAANPYFLQALAPFLTIVNKLSPEALQEAEFNAVYFGCPDGIHTLVNFYKLIERECGDIHLLSLSEEQDADSEDYLDILDVTAPFVALHARDTEHDSARNVTTEQIENALEPYLARGYSVVSTGIDSHPINKRFPSVLSLTDPMKASFILSACCNQFIGSNSGAWTIAHAYQRPVEIMNDWEHAAWIYP